MIDWLTVLIALVIIIGVVGFFWFLASKINISDPLTQIETSQTNEIPNEKRRKDKNLTELTKKKRKEQKKLKRENKDEDEKQSKQLQTTEETDDEREESEQELIHLPIANTETSTKARKRNKNKSTNESKPTTARIPPATHPKSTSKDEIDFSKQQTKIQTTGKQITTTKNVTNQSHVQEQPFTVVGGNRQKNSTQQNKTHANGNSSASIQQEQLPQRQQQTLPVKETSAPIPVKPIATQAPVKQTTTVTQVSAKQTSAPVSVKQQTPTPAPAKQQTSLPAKQIPITPAKVADIIKVLPTSQAVVTELMSALDAFPLSADELDIIMHKIANKQSVVKQDWSKLQQGQKVDPQAHIGQILDESAKAYQDEMKNNSLKLLKELTDELNEEKRHNNELSKEKTLKEREIQFLHAQLESIQQNKSQPNQVQQKVQTLELQLQRLTEENLRLNQQQTHRIDPSNVQIQVLSEHIRKLSVDNGDLEKKLHHKEILVEEIQKEKTNLIHYNEQLTQTLTNKEKYLQTIEEKHHQQINDIRTIKSNEINEYKHRIQQLENENEQLKREEIIHVEPSSTDIQTISVNSEERQQLENDIQQYKQQIEHLQNQFAQDVERLKQENLNAQQQLDESLNALRTELNSQSEDRLRHERANYRQKLLEILPEHLRQQFSIDNQEFDQWFQSYRQSMESYQKNLQDLQNENQRLEKNMNEIANQLKEIETTVQTREESLLQELRNKDSIIENLRDDSQKLSNELQKIQSTHEITLRQVHSLKCQLDERVLASNNSPSVLATADESFELVKQPSPSLSPIVVDVRAEQFNELIRSSKEALENQEILAQQLDQHLDAVHQTEFGEASQQATVSTSNEQS